MRCAAGDAFRPIVVGCIGGGASDDAALPRAHSVQVELECALESLSGRIFCGKPVPTPDQVRGRLFPENAPSTTHRRPATRPAADAQTRRTVAYDGRHNQVAHARARRMHKSRRPMNHSDPERVTILVDDARSVSGLLLAPPRARACYVLAHGAGAGMTHAFMERVATELGERGIATLRYQFPSMEQG